PSLPDALPILGAAVLDALGPDGFLINVARGSVVNEDDLIHALEQGRIHGAGLDVFKDEPAIRSDLKNFSNVVLLPHIGSGTAPTRRAMAQLVLDNLTQWFAGKGPVTPVQETPWPWKGH